MSIVRKLCARLQRYTIVGYEKYFRAHHETLFDHGPSIQNNFYVRFSLSTRPNSDPPQERAKQRRRLSWISACPQSPFVLPRREGHKARRRAGRGQPATLAA